MGSEERVEHESGTRMRGMPRHALSSRSESFAAVSLRLDATLLVSLRDVEGESRSEQEDASSRELGSGHEERRRRRRAPRGSEGGEIERLDLGRQRRVRRGQDAPLLRRRGATGRCEEQGGSGREEWARV